MAAVMEELRVRSRSRGRSYSDPPRPMGVDLGPFSASCTLPLGYIAPPIDVFIRRSKDFSLKRDTEEDIGVEGAKWVESFATEVAPDDWEIVAIENANATSSDNALSALPPDGGGEALKAREHNEEEEEDDEEEHEGHEGGADGNTGSAPSMEDSTELEYTYPSMDGDTDSMTSFTPELAGDWEELQQTHHQHHQHSQRTYQDASERHDGKDSNGSGGGHKDKKDKKAKKIKDKDKAKRAKKKERKAAGRMVEKLSPRELAHIIAAKTNNFIASSAPRFGVPPIQVSTASDAAQSDRSILSRSRALTSDTAPTAANISAEALGVSGSLSERNLTYRQPLNHNYDDLPDRQKAKIQKVLGVVPERSHTKLMKLLGEDMPLACSGSSLLLPIPSSPRTDATSTKQGEAYATELGIHGAFPVHRKRTRSISWSYFNGAAAAVDDEEDETTEEEPEHSTPSSPPLPQPSWFAAFQKRLLGADASEGNATYRIRRKRTESNVRKPSARGELDDDGGGTIIISSPANTRQGMNIDFRWEWKGGDPVSQFEFSAKLGQGYHISSHA
jgi:hypothetical protein